MPIDPMTEQILRQHAENMTEIHGKGLNSLIKISSLATKILADPYKISGDELTDRISDLVNPFNEDDKEEENEDEENDA